MPSASPRPVLAAYLSGHGYGHFTRSAAVLETLAERYQIHLRTSAQSLQLAHRAPWFASVTEVDVGPGVVQRGPLGVDLPATLAALQQHVTRLPSLVAAEAAWLRAVGARAVFADIPPLAFAAAAAAGLPSLGMSNFSWSWIYQGYAHHDPRFGACATELAALEERATSLLSLEGGGGLEHFPHPRAIAPVVRRPHPSYRGPDGRARLRRRLGLATDDPRPVVLVSFGGFGAELDLRHAALHNRDLRLLLVSAPRELRFENARAVEPDQPDLVDLPDGETPRDDHEPDRLTHPDLVAAADCLIGKPGYGTVAECLLAPTALVHVPRGEFREQPALVELIGRWLPEAPLAVEDFVAGRWSEAVAAALASTPLERPPSLDGISQAATAIIEAMG